MRPDKFLERFHEVSNDRVERNAFPRYHCYTFGFYRMMEQSFITYQSTHFPDSNNSSVTRFPFAWSLRPGDKVKNISKNELYTVKRSVKIVKENSAVNDGFPNHELWEDFYKEGAWFDYTTLGWVGFDVVLVSSDGDVVVPPTHDVLLLETANLMALNRADPVKTSDDHVVNPDALNETRELHTSNTLPQVRFFKDRMEPDGGKEWFSSSTKQSKPKVSTIRDPQKPGVSIIESDVAKELLITYQLSASTVDELDLFEVYFENFINRCAKVWRANGIKEWAYWESKTEDRRVNVTLQHTMFVKIAFKIKTVINELVVNRSDVSLIGEVQPSDGSEGSGAGEIEIS